MIVAGVKFSWQYEKVVQGEGKEAFITVTTRCIADAPNGMQTIATYECMLNEFCRDACRKITLKGVMNAVGVDRDVRGLAWEAYRTMPPIPRWKNEKQERLKTVEAQEPQVIQDMRKLSD